MREKLTIIRDPKVFSNEKTSIDRRTPFEIYNQKGFNGFRNAETKPYQNYTSYRSSNDDLSILVNKAGEVCKEPFILTEKIYKVTEDILGNRYLLFKDISDENTLKEKGDGLGRLFVFDKENKPIDSLGEIVVADLLLRDVSVFFDKIALISNEDVKFASVYEFEFITETYSSHFNIIYDGKYPLFLSDKIVGEFHISRYDGKNITELTIDPLQQLITTSVINVKNNRYEIIITNSDVISREDQTLQFHEYDTIDGEWIGVEFPNFFFEVIGGYSEKNSWFVFHEQLTYPNFVGGVEYRVTPPSQENLTIEVINPNINLKYGQKLNEPFVKKVEYLGDLSSLDGIKFRGIEITSDGRLVLIPYDANNICFIDPQNDTVEISLSTQGFDSGNSKWIDGVTASDGRTYFSPSGANKGLVVDVTTSPPTLTEFGGAWQTRGIVEVDSNLYLSKYAGSETLYKYNIDTGIAAAIPYTLDRTGPFYQSYPNWDLLPFKDLFDRHWGISAAPNKKIYITPLGSDRVLIYDTVNEVAYQGVDTLTGNRRLPTPEDAFNLDWDYNIKYTGSTYSKINQCVYAFPRQANSILKIDTNTDRAIEIPLPQELQNFNGDKIYGSISKSFASVEGPNGIIFSSPWNNEYPYLFWIDPRTDSIGYMNIEEWIPNFGGMSGLFYTYACAVGNSIYYAPGYANKVLKITL